ncbi:hypothetical protein ILUMI_19792 [Ignelater luminosus]|uniref:DDE-1 domain-containing protein n=1 Tax=Ignelater luminosus TaxID=2038154 RepID=A0A8K0G590_IGNLU|nr:hypothetical protein ILUMI_19792 [Ignelater luminosus]
MVRTYVRKTKHGQWTQENMRIAAEKVLAEQVTLRKPAETCNVDETGMPLNNNPPNIIAKKRSNDVVSMTSVEQGQNVTVLACMNAAGQFIPSFVLFKGVRKRHDFMIGMPSDTEVAMTEKCWVTDETFKLWLQHFNRYQTKGKVILILDDGNTPESKNKQQLDGTLPSVDAEQVDDAQPSTTHQRVEDTQSPTCSKQLANERSDSIDVRNTIKEIVFLL